MKFCNYLKMTGRLHLQSYFKDRFNGILRVESAAKLKGGAV